MADHDVTLGQWLQQWPGNSSWTEKAGADTLRAWQEQVRENEEGPSNEALPAHAGLWLDRCLVEPQPSRNSEKEGHPGRDALHHWAVRALEHPQAPARVFYESVYKRWNATARARSRSTLRTSLELKATSRILLHQAAGSTVTEGGILLHHTYGVPYLPGSALKGICRARARRLSEAFPEKLEHLGLKSLPQRGMEKEPFWLTELLGFVGKEEPDGEGESQSGLFDFWDALWVPTPDPSGKSARSPLARDIVNPHHSQYYTDSSHPAPTPTGEPIPTHFLTMAPGSRFLLVLEAPNLPGMKLWLDFILEELLLPALAQDGIGARTSSGYGRLEPTFPATPNQPSGGTPASTGETGPADDTREEPGLLSRQKNDGSLRAVLPDNTLAEARGAWAKELFEGLDPDVRSKIDRGKPQRLLVRWRRVGNAKQIVTLRVP